MNGAQALIRTLVDAERGRLLREPRARRRCTSSPRSTPCPRCARCSACSRASSPARPTATRGWPTGPPRRCCTSGPGLGNGIANLHNARRGSTPIVNIVGDHATYHHQYDAPLESDIDALASNVSGWIRTVAARRGRRRRRRRGRRGGAPAARPGRHAGPPGRRVVARGRDRRAHPVRSRPAPHGRPTTSSRSSRRRCAPVSRSSLLLGGAAVREPAAARRGADRGRHGREGDRRDVPGPRSSAAPGCPPLDRLGVPGRVRDRAARGHAPPRARRREGARCRSSPTRTSRAPSCPTTARCTCSRPDPDDAVDALERLADAVGCRWAASPCWQPRAAPTARPARSRARRSPTRVGALLPEGAIVADEAQTGGLWAAGCDRGCAAARLAHAHRRCDRHGHAARDRRGGRVPRPPGDQPRGRRQRDVHDAVAVDPGPRGARRHHDHLREPLLRDPQPRAEPRRGASRRARRR